jgi:uncharacterized protein
METIVINGVEYQVEKSVAQAYRADSKRLEGERMELVKKAEAATGRLDAATEELKATQEKLAAAEDPKRFDSAVQERISLLEQARKVVGADARFDGKSRREVMEAVLRHDNKDLDLTKKSDDYVEARFDTFVESSRPHPSLGTTQAAAHAAATGGSDADKFDSAAAHERMRKEMSEAWKKPLAFSKDNG